MNKVKLNFNISFSELNVLVNSKTSFAQRDEEALAPYGYTIEKIDQIRSINTNLLALPTDALMELNRKDLTVEKNSMIDTAHSQLSTISYLVKIMVGRNSASIADLKLVNVHDLSEPEFLLRILTIISLLENRLISHPNFSSIQPAIEELKQTATQFTSLMVQVRLSDSERSIATQGRTILANELYDELMQMCQAGKMVWKDTDPVKFQDYIVHETSGTAITADEETVVEPINSIA